VANEVIKLMIRVNKHAKKSFEQKINMNEQGDKKRFQVEIKYFVEWFHKHE